MGPRSLKRDSSEKGKSHVGEWHTPLDGDGEAEWNVPENWGPDEGMEMEVKEEEGWFGELGDGGEDVATGERRDVGEEEHGWDGQEGGG